MLSLEKPVSEGIWSDAEASRLGWVERLHPQAPLCLFSVTAQVRLVFFFSFFFQIYRCKTCPSATMDSVKLIMICCS